MMKKVSVVIPAYNEEQVVGNCLESLLRQTFKPLEIIVVDDGSTDNTIGIVKKYQLSCQRLGSSKAATFNCQLLRQKHLGPGSARNLGASKAKGEILVFVDADMTFDKNFIKDLTKPIIEEKTIGTFSKNELVKNRDDIWSICWNINRNVPRNRMIPKDYPDTAPVFRAILKSEFEKVRGFDITGEYIDDWSLSKKLGIKSRAVKGAYYYHYNPSNLKEVYKQARWIGKNEFIVGSIARKTRSLVVYSFPLSILIGFHKSILNLKLQFLIFKIAYDFGIFVSVLKTFTREPKYKL